MICFVVIVLSKNSYKLNTQNQHPRIPKEFQNNFKGIPKKFPSRTPQPLIPEEFPKIPQINSQKIPKKLLSNYLKISESHL
jgi:hypothetical protein